VSNASEPTRPRDDARVRGNTRLTATTGAFLFVLFFIEGLTLLNVRASLTWHVVVGGLILPFVVVKVGATLWRFAKYYLGAPAYVRHGAPHFILRVLGPLQILLTVGLLATGLYLVLASPSTLRDHMVQWHKWVFFPWFGVTTVHVLGHFLETAKHAPADYRPRERRQATGTILRPALLLLTIAAAIAVGIWLGPKAATYINPFHFGLVQ
jgi:hypothetical protein